MGNHFDNLLISKEMITKMTDPSCSADLEVVKMLKKHLDKIIDQSMINVTRKCSKCKQVYNFQEEFKYKNTYFCRRCLKEAQNNRYKQIKDEIIVCNCGQEIKKYSQKAHLQTKKHELQFKCKNFLMT